MFSGHLMPMEWGFYKLSDNFDPGTTTYSKVAFNARIAGNSSHFDTSTYLWTPPAGPVFLNTVLWSSGTGRESNTYIAKNGTRIAKSNDYSNYNNYDLSGNIHLFDVANGTDTYEVQSYRAEGNRVLLATNSVFQFVSFGFQSGFMRRGVNHPKGGVAAFQAIMSADQTIPTAWASYTVNFDSVVFDTHNRYDTVNKRWTPPAGLALLGAFITCTDVQRDAAYIYINKNAGQINPGVDLNGVSRPWSGANSIAVVSLAECNGSDYFDIGTYVGTTNRHLTSAAYNNSFSGIVWPHTGGLR